MSKFKYTIEEKGDEKALNIVDLLHQLAEKHEVRVDNIMIGVMNDRKEELHVFEYDDNKPLGNKFKVLEIIHL